MTKVGSNSQERYKVRYFAKWAKRVGVSDRVLLNAITEMDKGLLGDRLGAHVYKKRLRIDGRGKRGGARVIVLYRAEDVVLFLHGYLKNESDDMSENEIQQVRLFAGQFLVVDRSERARLCAEGKLVALDR